MNKLHYIVKSMNVLNCLLTLALAAAVSGIVVPHLNLKIQTTLPAAGKTEPEPVVLPSSPASPPFHDYTVITDQNLFHPQRRIPPEKSEKASAVAAAVAPVPKPELILYGTLIGDNLNVAYVEDKKAPHSTPGRGKRQMQLKKGDSIHGYVLREIEPNRIVLVKGEDRLVVLLDEKERKRGGETAAAAAAPAAAATPAAGTAPALPARGIPLRRSSTPLDSRQTTVSSGVAGSSAPVPAATPPAAAGTPAASQGTTTSPTTVTPPPTTDTPPPTAGTPAGTPEGPPEATPPATTVTPGYAPTQRGGPYYTRPGKRPYDIRPTPYLKP